MEFKKLILNNWIGKKQKILNNFSCFLKPFGTSPFIPFKGGKTFQFNLEMEYKKLILNNWIGKQQKFLNNFSCFLKPFGTSPFIPFKSGKNFPILLGNGI